MGCGAGAQRGGYRCGPAHEPRSTPGAPDRTGAQARAPPIWEARRSGAPAAHARWRAQADHSRTTMAALRRTVAATGGEARIARAGPNPQDRNPIAVAPA